jgi:hypothetical protein
MEYERYQDRREDEGQSDLQVMGIHAAALQLLRLPSQPTTHGEPGYVR